MLMRSARASSRRGVVNRQGNAPVTDHFHSLVDDVLHVAFHLIELLAGNQLLHPAGVEIHKVARTSTVVGKVLNGQPQPPRTRRPHHEPFAATRKVAVVKVVPEFLVVDLVVVPANPLLGHSRGAARFKDIERPVAEPSRHKALVLLVPQPFVLEMRKLVDVGKGPHLRARIPAGLLRPVEPERTARLRTEMPGNDGAEVFVEAGSSFLWRHGW